MHSHNASHHQAGPREKAAVHITVIGAIVNVLLAALKLAAGILGHSAAMIADAVHSLSDLVSDVVVVLFVKVAAMPADEHHDFGHGKFETLSAVIVGLLLFGVSIGLLKNGADQLLDIYHGVKGEGPGLIAMIAAVVSIVAKEILFRYTKKEGQRLNAPAVIANAWHHRSDALSSIGTLVGISGAIILGDSWRFLDPLAAVIVAVIIGKAAYDVIADAIGELLEKSLPPDQEEEILKIIMETPSIRDPHNLCTRRIGASIAIEVHIRLAADMTVHDAHEITRQVEARLRKRYGEWTHVLTHVEPY